MKRILLVIVSLSCFTCFGQDTIVNYLDSKRNIVTKNKASYTQLVVKDNSNWRAITYSNKAELLSENIFSDKKLTKMIGVQRYFHSNGKLRSLWTYDRNGNKEGKAISFHKDGTKNMVGNYQKNKREGVWNFYYENGNKKARLIYQKDKIIKDNLWFENGEVRNEELIFEKRPIFKGEDGRKGITKYIRKKLIPKLRSLKATGRIIIKFTINTAGRADEIQILPENIPSKYQKRIQTFFEEMPNWEPGIQLNNKVPVKFTFPIKLN